MYRSKWIDDSGAPTPAHDHDHTHAHNHNYHHTDTYDHTNTYNHHTSTTSAYYILGILRPDDVRRAEWSTDARYRALVHGKHRIHDCKAIRR